MIHWVDFCEKWRVCFYTGWMSNCFSSVYWKDQRLSIEFPFLLCQQLTTFVWVYFWVFYSISLSNLFILSPILHYFDCCSFIISFEVRWYLSSTLFLTQYYTGYSESLAFPYKLLCVILSFSFCILCLHGGK